MDTAIFNGIHKTHIQNDCYELNDFILLQILLQNEIDEKKKLVKSMKQYYNAILTFFGIHKPINKFFHLLKKDTFTF